MGGILSLFRWGLNLLRLGRGVLVLVSLVQVALVVMLVASWFWSGGSESSSSNVPTTLTNAIEELADQVPVQLPCPERALRPTLVVPLAGDRENLVTQAIADALDRQGWYRSIKKKALDEWMGKIAPAAAASQPADLAAALKMGRAVSAEVVLFGRVDKLGLGGRDPEVAFSLHAVEVDGGVSLFEGSFINVSTRPALPAVSESRRVWPVLLGLAAFAVLFPPATIPLMRRALRRESNAANLLTILLITFVPALAAAPVVYSLAAGWWLWLGFVTAVILTAVWSMAVMAWAAGME